MEIYLRTRILFFHKMIFQEVGLNVYIKKELKYQKVYYNKLDKKQNNVIISKDFKYILLHCYLLKLTMLQIIIDNAFSRRLYWVYIRYYIDFKIKGRISR